MFIRIHKHILITRLLILSLLLTNVSDTSAQESGQEENLITVLTGATIIDVAKEKSAIGHIMIIGSKIDGIVYNAKMDIPSGAIVYDLTGHYIIPGLIDAHVHFGTDPSGSDDRASTEKKLEYLLNHGVTSVRDMAGDARFLNYMARQAAIGEIHSPDIYFSALMAGATFFDDPRTHSSGKGVVPGDCSWMKAVDEETDLHLAISEAKGTGATGIKIYADLSGSIVEKITTEAHKQEMQVWAHACVFPARPLEIINADVDVISHATLLGWEDVSNISISAKERYNYLKNVRLKDETIKHVIDAMLKNDVILDATLAVFDREERDKTIFEIGGMFTKKAFENGVKIGVGTDNLNIADYPDQTPLLTEMILLIDEVGMSPIEVLKSATLINAEIIGIQGEVGSVEVGKKANLVVLRNNPLDDIRNVQSVRYVMKNGKVYSP